MACTVKGCDRPVRAYGHCSKHMALLHAQNINKVPVPTEAVTMRGAR